MNRPSNEPEFWWISGRAASGKSTLVKIATEACSRAGIQTQNLCDEKFMLQIIGEDINHEHHYHPDNDEKFLFKSGYPFNEGIRRISEECKRQLDLAHTKPMVAIIELARGKTEQLWISHFKRLFH